MTNAKLTSVYLKAEKPREPWTDERDYVYPDKLLRQYIPQEVFDFFDRMHDPDIPDDAGIIHVTNGKPTLVYDEKTGG